MRIVKGLLVGLFAMLVSTAANATAYIHIDLSTQRMHVESSEGSHDWAVSTARTGYYTPRGSFAPTGMQRMHYSRKYDNSPMPYSIFFRGGYAIHGSYHTGSLGRPASHGCVRLSPGNAALLYRIVQNEGGRISITGSPPGSARFASHRHHHHASALAYASTHHRHHRHSGVRGWQEAPDLPYYYDYDR